MLANPIPRKKEHRANKINLLEEIVSETALTRPEEFEKGGFTLKTHEMFSVHTKPEEFKNTTITGLLRFVFDKTRTGKKRDYCNLIVFGTRRFPNCFLSTQKTQSQRF